MSSSTYSLYSDEKKRFGASFGVSLLLHALIILGIGFTLEKAGPVMPTLDVILTQTESPLTRKQADFLAQASNEGGGEHDKSLRPRDSQPGVIPQPEDGIAPQAIQAQSPTQNPPPQTRVVSTLQSENILPTPENSPAADPSQLPLGKQHIERDLAMARLAAEIHQRQEMYAKRPKRKFISASTQEYAWAGYMRQWVDRVERVGNLNYPDEARQRRLSGSVVISVAVRKDGSVERAEIVQSSGIKLLDSAALRIVRLAEPYPPLPKTDENINILHITRTWQFLPGGEMQDHTD